MSNYHHTVVSRRPLHSAPTEAKPVAEVVFEAQNPHNATAFILDALDALGFPKADSGMLSEFGDIVRLDGLPRGMLADKPDWSNDSVKVWLISSSNQTMQALNQGKSVVSS
jgi:hypothetical protein